MTTTLFSNNESLKNNDLCVSVSVSKANTDKKSTTLQLNDYLILIRKSTNKNNFHHTGYWAFCPRLQTFYTFTSADNYPKPLVISYRSLQLSSFELFREKKMVNEVYASFLATTERLYKREIDLILSQVYS